MVRQQIARSTARIVLDLETAVSRYSVDTMLAITLRSLYKKHYVMLFNAGISLLR